MKDQTATWQPISTAPKTGRFIIGMIEGSTKERWERYRLPKAVHWSRRYGDNGFATYNGFETWRDERGNNYPATHWMPIPELLA